VRDKSRPLAEIINLRNVLHMIVFL